MILEKIEPAVDVESADAMPTAFSKLYRLALLLAGFTILYNIAEGVISVFWGLEDETISLFGFGLDSFVEVISGAGILHLVLRLRNSDTELPDQFERTALRITGGAFYLLTISLIATAGLNLYAGKHPETTFWGIVISLISIATMWALIVQKRKVAHALKSDALVADANCTRACLYLSIVLLVSSAGYALTGIGYLDALGALGIAWFAFKEGREAFEKAKGKLCYDCH